MSNTPVETEQFFLRTIRRLGITQGELAERGGFSGADISRYKQQKQRPSLGNIERLALAMELDVITLMIGLGAIDPDAITTPEVPLHNWRRA